MGLAQGRGAVHLLYFGRPRGRGWFACLSRACHIHADQPVCGVAKMTRAPFCYLGQRRSGCSACRAVWEENAVGKSVQASSTARGIDQGRSRKQGPCCHVYSITYGTLWEFRSIALMDARGMVLLRVQQHSAPMQTP